MDHKVEILAAGLGTACGFAGPALGAACGAVVEVLTYMFTTPQSKWTVEGFITAFAIGAASGLIPFAGKFLGKIAGKALAKTLGPVISKFIKAGRGLASAGGRAAAKAGGGASRELVPSPVGPGTGEGPGARAVRERPQWHWGTLRNPLERGTALRVTSSLNEHELRALPPDLARLAAV